MAPWARDGFQIFNWSSRKKNGMEKKPDSSNKCVCSSICASANIHTHTTRWCCSTDKKANKLDDKAGKGEKRENIKLKLMDGSSLGLSNYAWHREKNFIFCLSLDKLFHWRATCKFALTWPNFLTFVCVEENLHSKQWGIDGISKWLNARAGGLFANMCVEHVWAYVVNISHIRQMIKIESDENVQRMCFSRWFWRYHQCWRVYVFMHLLNEIWKIDYRSFVEQKLNYSNEINFVGE